MVKRSFIRGEQIIDSVVQKKMRLDLLKESEEVERKKHAEKEGGTQQVNTVETLLHQIKKDVLFLIRNGGMPSKEIGINEFQIEKYLEDPVALTPDDWQFLKEVKDNVAKLKAGVKEKQVDNEALIKDSRRVIAEKRQNLNVKNGWKPI
jgi:hypothetical protein